MSVAYLRTLSKAAVVAVTTFHLAPAGAQGWPERPVRSRPVADRLNAEVNAARAMPDVTQRLKELGFTLEGSGPRPDEFGESVKSEIALWARVVREAKIPQQ